MDLVQEYFDSKGYGHEHIRKYQKTQKKISLWQKKLKLKKERKTTIRKYEKSLSRSAMAAASARDVEVQSISSSNKLFSDVVISFHAKSNKDVNHWRQHTAQKLLKTAGTIEKYQRFEQKVRKSFRKSYEVNFPDSTEVLEDVLNLMFDTADATFKKTVLVKTEQITTVPETTARYLNIKSSIFDKIQKLVQYDRDVVRRMKTLPKAAFGQSLKEHYKIETHPDDFKSKWWSYTQHPSTHKDLETFAAVWKNITHLQTTRRFGSWLASNPQITPPNFLKAKGMLDTESLSFNRSDASNSTCGEYDHEVSEEQIKESLRQSMKTIQMVPSITSSGYISPVSVDISDINIIV